MAREEKEFREGLVSVVTPVYNGEAYLGRMLDSVLRQTYPRVEMILVDDGSTDGTLLVAEGYLDRFARRGYSFHIVKGDHQSASAAINRGLPLVTGEYLIWPDSDDVLEPDSIEKRVGFLRAHPEYQCVRSLPYYFEEGSGKRREEPDECRGDLAKEELFWDVLEGCTFICCGCYMLKSERLFEIYPDRRIPEYAVGQNFQMLLPYLYRHKCPTIREELYGVAVRSGSHSRRTMIQAQEEKKYRDYERLIDEIAEKCGISDRLSRDRIERWKAERRYQVALKYHCWGKAFSALRSVHSHGGPRWGRALKELIWTVWHSRA